MKRTAILENLGGRADHRLDDMGKPEDEENEANLLTRLRRDREIERLHASVDDLKAALEMALRRVSRLQGERKQLAALLDKRDERVQQLNRELGSRGVRPAGSSDGHDAWSWHDLSSALWKKIATFARVAEAKPAADGAVHQPMEEPRAARSLRVPLVANHKTSSPRAVLAVILFGLTDNEIERLLPAIERDCLNNAMMPLLLVDSDAFELLRERGLIFEYLPPASDRQRFAPRLRWDLYIQRRLALIRQKWQPIRIVAFGQVATETLRLWRDSPFEESSLPAVDS